MTRLVPLLAVSLLAPLGLSADAIAQTAIDETKESSSSGAPTPATSDRVGALLGALGPATVEPEKAEAPDVPERVSDKMRRCFSDAAKREVSMPGRIEVEFTLDRFEVSKATLKEGSSMDLLLRECVQGAVTGAEVTAKDGDYTWLFIPSAG